MKKIVWVWEHGVYVPICPHCRELAYEKDECVFCKKPYQWVEGKYKSQVVEVGDFTVIQTTNNNIHIYKDNRLVYHASCVKKMTEDELRKQVDYYLSLIKER